MSRSMIQAAVTMNQLQSKMDLISNNMANSQTTGYKTRQADFASLLFQQIDNMTDPANADGRLTPDGVRVGSGAKLGSVNIDLTPGSLQETERALDAALLEKNHLFQIQVTENDVTETRYTRDGSFYLSPLNGGEDVMLATKDGHPVLGENGPIIIEEGFDAITIDPDGQISVQRGNVNENAGNLAVTEAVRPQLLEASGDNTFRLPDLDELAFDFAEIMQPAGQNSEILRSGALEQSNVDIGSQMTDLLNAQRSYQFNARTISMGDQMMGLVNQLR
ncbi:flagellar basal-body rod protein FlgG [Lentibacillus persicus]|uniref:Flagellar basal-body rod protein FlgG n=1 Tax=Lentibacillus persicus TaxID=640948 RepID=A0A1I1XSR6_9BACI|nr:flagellar hook-basal body protein [Lentibacillus persicus]SFE10299.1 flagellar basal-body rod protein FlgG [Lentibacillus persicus]